MHAMVSHTIARRCSTTTSDSGITSVGRDPMRHILVTLLVLAATARPSAGINVCSFSEEIDFSGTPIPPFGGEYLGKMAAVGEIVNTNVAIQFTASGTFNAADIAVALEIIDASGGVGVSFSGAQFGWSGQGTFTHTFDTSLLNGLLYPGDQPFSTLIVTFSNLNPGHGPVTGNFDLLRYRIDFGPCPLGDVNHDLSVNVDDLLAVITNWGPCPAPPTPCNADTDGDHVVDVDDLLNVITHWALWCPKCS